MHGRVILDLDGTPVRNYTNIPVVLSSQLKGCYMEAMMREHPSIQVQDFVARMPKDLVKRNALSARIRRYRLEACCISWTRMEGSDNIKAYIDNLLPAKYIKTNLTECFRDLTNLEVEDIKRSILGTTRSGQVVGDFPMILDRLSKLHVPALLTPPEEIDRALLALNILVMVLCWVAGANSLMPIVKIGRIPRAVTMTVSMAWQRA